MRVLIESHHLKYVSTSMASQQLYNNFYVREVRQY